MILSILDNSVEKKYIVKAGFTYLLVSIFCALFGMVYEHFSHGVYSGYMIYAFVFPLAGGAFPFLTMAQIGFTILPGKIALNLYNAGIATVTVGSIMEGVLAIYGTTNGLLSFYWYVGFILIAGGIGLYIIHIVSRGDERVKNTKKHRQ